MGAWICLGFKSLKNYSQNETGSRAQREGSPSTAPLFPSSHLLRGTFPKEKEREKEEKKKKNFHKL